MTRCKEFYEKWKKNPNWCGKCPTSVFRINRYIELTEKYPFLVQFSEHSLRPLIESSIPQGELENIVQQIKNEYEGGHKLKEEGIEALIRPKPILGHCPRGFEGEQILECYYNRHNLAEFCPWNEGSLVNLNMAPLHNYEEVYGKLSLRRG